MDDIDTSRAAYYISMRHIMLWLNRGYMLRCCTMGADNQLKRQEICKKSPASFHRECGRWSHSWLVIISVHDVKPCRTGLLLRWVTIQKYTTSIRVHEDSLPFRLKRFHLTTSKNNFQLRSHISFPNNNF